LIVMSLPNTEIVIAPSSEAYRADPNVLINGFEPLSKVDGLENIYFGIQLEDSKTAYVFESKFPSAPINDLLTLHPTTTC